MVPPFEPARVRFSFNPTFNCGKPVSFYIVRLRIFLVLAILAILTGQAFGQANIARHAKATASEMQTGLPPELAVDGLDNTRWSGIPGHNSDVWFQLTWSEPQQVGQILVK